MNPRRTSAALCCATLFASLPGQAQERASLADLINAYRAAPQTCEGRRTGARAPLAVHPALNRVQVAPGTVLEQALERAGYPVARAEVISITGPQDARSVLDTIAGRYCSTLLSTQFSAMGTARHGDGWQIVLAQPAPPSRIAQLPGQRDAGNAILTAVNAARASPRTCGAQRYGAAPPLAWHGALAEAALAHSRDMAMHRYLSHQGKDGRDVAERALQAGYRWLRVGENIAVGQESPDDVVSGWLASPGHCANIMSPGFREMGAAYALNQSRAYWTQVFGAPR